ncbi:hypothetical protein HJG60_011845 [Phyllostomus discolor]|uniref:Uncharacterized protein n=1 Tax=Phyllostomus discolor TaxID=89673 RepID=A0A834DYE0_9CHIR|nr:hypothetical protein HJG60_011845 [Phyllostomus discolor]
MPSPLTAVFCSAPAWRWRWTAAEWAQACEQSLEEEPASCRSGLMRLDTAGLGVTANSSHTRNGNKKVLEEMEELPGLSPEALDFSSGSTLLKPSYAEHHSTHWNLSFLDCKMVVTTSGHIPRD